MRKLSIKEVIEFRNRSNKSRKYFVDNLKFEKNSSSDSGGDYWISSLSAISKSYKLHDLQFIRDKITFLKEKREGIDNNRTKDMYSRNIQILETFDNYDFAKWMPSSGVRFIKKHKEDLVISILGFRLKVTPQHVFSFKFDGFDQVGAIWFIAKLDGYRLPELGMFADIMHRYLMTYYSEHYKINSNFCIAVDVVNDLSVSYSQLANTEVPAHLSSSLEEMKKLL